MLITDYVKETDDWGPVIQQAVKDLTDPNATTWPDESGGRIEFPRGHYEIRTPVVINVAGISLVGEGDPRSYACWLDWRAKTEEAMFVVGSEQFSMAGLRCYGRKHGVALRFTAAGRGGYLYGYHFSYVGLSYFRKVFEFPGPETFGGVTVLDSRICYNGQVLDAPKYSVNEWEFNRCRMEKNGLLAEGWLPEYAFSVDGTDNGSFVKCILEDTPRVMDIRRAHGIRVQQCRFERNAAWEGSTDAVCRFRDCTGVRIDQVFHRVLKAESWSRVPPTMLLENCHDYQVDPQLGRVEIRRRWESRY